MTWSFSPELFYSSVALTRSKNFHFFIEIISSSLSSIQLLAEESLPTTPFSFILGKHRQQQDTKSTETSESELVQLPLTENIPAITEVSGQYWKAWETEQIQ